MSPELGITLFVTLLYAPTALWLVYRTLRGPRLRVHEPFNGVSEPLPRSELAPDEPEMLVSADGSWVCGPCRSLNRRQASRCYSCRAEKGAPGGQAPGALPVSNWVPVMADGIARTSGEAAVTAVAPALPGNAPGAPEILVHAPGHVVSAVPPSAPAGLAVCPFLGFRDDPSTRYDFPDPANLCHASSEPGATPEASPRRFVGRMPGTGRSQPIGAEHQASVCLTPMLEACARYAAVAVVAASR